MHIRFIPRTSPKGPVADVQLIFTDEGLPGVWTARLGAVWKNKPSDKKPYWFSLESSAYVKEGEVKKVELYSPVGDAPVQQHQQLVDKVCAAYERFIAQQEPA
jgi:hypothetical protein